MSRAALLALLALLAGCVGGKVAVVPSPGSGDAGLAIPGLVMCTGRDFPTPRADGWDHRRHHVTERLGSARHYAQDVIAPPGEPVAMSARFMYGKGLKDLEDETIDVFVDDCVSWVGIGSAKTDDEGRAGFVIDHELAPGAHEVRAVVRGDASEARAILWILPAGAPVVVTDVDGTMTTDDEELFRAILDGEHVPRAYPGGAELTRAHAALGHVVVYLTGRPYWLLAHTRGWLAGLGFAPGPVHVADSHGDILPTEESVGAYKHAWLAALMAAGYVVEVAYGNATTDVHAYLEAGLSPERVFIIGPHAGLRGTQPVQGSWESRVDEVTTTRPPAP